MKNLSRILSMMLCFAPLCVNAAGTVATTSGSNLTAFNPSNAYNNQWASLSNGRYDENTASAKVDFGNCNAVVLRCAQPKCSNGGCADSSVASAIVAGCVQSNENCKQYGNDLVQYMTAQLVASSNAKINEQNAAAQQAAAAAAAQQSQQQMAAMQQQMQQMQQQMAQQQAESAAQLQNALAQQAAQNASALESVKNAATDAAKENEAGISAYQQDAINRGVSADVIERQKITGQVMTELENAEVQLKTVRESMNAAFEYAKCDTRGNNCEGPKRVKKWRELATAFIQPYDETINKVYDALELAQLVGVDLSDIYMMLNNSCNRWGQYMCPRMPGGQIRYPDSSNGSKSVPEVCTGGFEVDNECARGCWESSSCNQEGCADNKTQYDACLKTCNYKNKGLSCQPCTLLKVLSNGEDVYEGWVDADYSTDKGNATVVACASGALDSSALFARRTKNKNGAGLIDLDKLEVWLSQKEPNKISRSSLEPSAYCDVYTGSDGDQMLEKSMLSRTVDEKTLCVEGPNGSGFSTSKDTDCGYVHPAYAICDTHPYNIGKTGASDAADTDSNDCTASDIAKDDTLGDNKDKIVWAIKNGTKCEVKWCNSDYRPSDNKKSCQQLTAEDDKKEWKSGKPDYDKAFHEYKEHMMAKFGEMHEIIAMKTTVISQQMYKQYEYLSATLRRLKTQLEKATLTAKLQAAGAKDDESSSSGLLGGGSSKTSQYRDCSGKNMQGTVDCLRENYSILQSQINNKKCDRYARQELVRGIETANDLLSDKRKIQNCYSDKDNCTKEPESIDACKTYLRKYSSAMTNLDREMSDDEAKRSGKYRD